MDTVHPVGSFPGGPFTRRDGCVYGPGVHDCKGGLVMALYVIRALQHIGYDRRQLRLALVSDEETGHSLSQMASVEFLERHAQGCGAAFTFESGLLNGDIVTGRKGGGVIRLTVEGIASHCGTAPEKGASAVREAARKVVAIEDLTDFSRVTFNCGLIRGGSSVNTIPAHCEVVLDMRYTTMSGKEKLLARLDEICKKTYIDGTSTKYAFLNKLDVFETTGEGMRFFEYVRGITKEYGLPEVNGRPLGGGSDAASTTMAGVPTICSCGVRGQWNHTMKEYAVVDSIFDRSKMYVAAVANSDQFAQE